MRISNRSRSFLGIALLAAAGFLLSLPSDGEAQAGNQPQSAPAAGAAGVAGTAGAPAKVADGVAAVVGDHPILRSEVEEQFGMLAPQFQVDPNDTSQANELRRQILDNMISELLLDKEAAAKGIKVDEAAIQRAVDEAIQGDRQRLGADGFAKQLQKEGITEADLRKRYTDEARKDYLRRQLLQREIFSKIVVSDADVQKQFEEHKGDIGKKPRALRVLDLFVRISPDSTIERTYRQKAQDIYEEIQKGLAFDEAARRYSDDENSRDQGGLLGRFGPGDLGDRNFESRAFTLPIGEVSRPIRTNLGYHLIQVMDRDSSGAWAQVRHILVKITPTRSDESRTRARVDEIRKEIVSGAIDFAEAVRKYSDDPATRQTGGDVGWLPIDNFLGDTQGAVDSLRVGQISRPAKVEGGFHLFKLLGEQAETDYTFDEVRDQLRAMVERDERQKKLEAYIAELRNKTFVEVRRNP